MRRHCRRHCRANPLLHRSKFNASLYAVCSRRVHELLAESRIAWRLVTVNGSLTRRRTFSAPVRRTYMHPQASRQNAPIQRAKQNFCRLLARSSEEHKKKTHTHARLARVALYPKYVPSNFTSICWRTGTRARYVKGPARLKGLGVLRARALARSLVRGHKTCA